MTAAEERPAESARRYAYELDRLRRIEATTHDPAEALNAARHIRKLQLMGETSVPNNE